MGAENNLKNWLLVTLHNFMVKKERGDGQILRAQSEGGKVVGHRDERWQ